MTISAMMNQHRTSWITRNDWNPLWTATVYNPIRMSKGHEAGRWWSEPSCLFPVINSVIRFPTDTKRLFLPGSCQLETGDGGQMWLMYDHILYLLPHTLTRSLPTGNVRHEPGQASHLMFLLHFCCLSYASSLQGQNSVKHIVWAFNDVLCVGVDVQGSRFRTSSKIFLH